jgi:hypothetical protein
MTSSPPTTDAPRPAPRRRSRRKHGVSDRAEFLSEFPQDAALLPAIAAFTRGDYRATRRVCSGLLEQDLDPEVQEAARELLRRLAPDRLVMSVLWGSFLLLALIVLWAYGRQ